MKTFKLFLVILVMTFACRASAQPFLVLSAMPLCNDVEVVAYAYDGSCNLIEKTLRITVPATGMPATSFDLSTPAYWPLGNVPTGIWTIEDVSVEPDIACNLGSLTGSTNCVLFNAAILHTGLNSSPCTTYTPTECFEYLTGTPCGSCGSSDIVNVNLNLVGSNINVHIY